MEETKLVRGISRWGLTAITINAVIGAGIFGLPSKAAALMGTYSLFAFVVCGIIVAMVAYTCAEVASRFHATGGVYLYAREAFGPATAFEIGWLYWIVRATSFAANCNLLVTYLGVFLPSAHSGITRILIILAVTLTLLTVDIIGVRQSSRLTNFFTIGKLLPLAVFIIIGAFFIHPANFTFGPVPDYSSTTSAVLLLIYAFVGFENALIPAGETKDAKKNVPVALLTGVGVVIVFYILIQIVSIGTLPGLAASDKPLVDAAVHFMGKFGGWFIAAGAAVSIIGNLNVSVLGSTRLLFAMGENRELPSFLSMTHPRFKTPYYATLITGVVIIVLTIQSSFVGALTISTITRLLVYAIICIALPVFRRRPDAPEASFRAPFGVAASVLSLILIVWLLSNVDFAKEGVAVFLAAFVGLMMYFAYRFYRRGRAASV